jgi:hypothetical protein
MFNLSIKENRRTILVVSISCFFIALEVRIRSPDYSTIFCHSFLVFCHSFLKRIYLTYITLVQFVSSSIFKDIFFTLFK